MWRRFIEWLDWADRIGFLWSLITAAKVKVAVVIAAMGGGLLGGVLSGLLAGSIAFFLLNLPALLRYWKVKQDNAPSATNQHGIWERHFDRLLRFEINQVYLRGLWKDDIRRGVEDNPEPFVRFQIVVYNDTDLDLRVVGCRGSATIDGDVCTLAAVIEPLTVSPWSYTTPTIKQPLLGGLGEDLINATRTSRRIQVSLGSVQLLVEGDGLAQRPVAIGISFEMDGTGVEPATGVDGLTKSHLLVKRP